MHEIFYHLLSELYVRAHYHIKYLSEGTTSHYLTLTL